MRFASLGSGSKGNATLVHAGDALVLVDCGFSLRETTRRLARLDLGPEALSAILVTHEHGDHCSGVATLSRKHNIPVYLTHGTANSGRCDGASEVRYISGEQWFSIDGLDVQAVTVPHDAAEPCQFRLEFAGRSLGILTDLGHVTPHVIESYRGCNSLLLEFNHDSAMLQAGSYPPPLKHRVGGDWGHLNNEQAASLLRQLDAARLNHLVVAHISENNNCRELASAALGTAMESMDNVVWACQMEGFGWLEV
jgi:phosphoribosyl 1,2-cyclic phosphodiesterase